MLEVNLMGPYRTIKRCMFGMIGERQGRIVNGPRRQHRRSCTAPIAPEIRAAGADPLRRPESLGGTRNALNPLCRYRQQLFSLRMEIETPGRISPSRISWVAVPAAETLIQLEAWAPGGLPCQPEAWAR
jgi:hypothetical protein